MGYQLHATKLDFGVFLFKVTVTDLKIIRALQVDARTSYTDLAKELGVSKNTISNRVRLLKENGVITGSLLLVNFTKFGNSCITTLGVNVVPSKLDAVIKYVKSVPGADFCSGGLGTYNLIVFLFLENTEQLKHVIDEIKKEPAVLQVNTSIWTSVEKAVARPQNIDLTGLLEGKTHGL
jgi:Lrp/AsnC family transcriptional regulator for asnA, asnC and gidA